MNAPFRLRPDLTRLVIDGFLMPLGVAHAGGRRPRGGWSCGRRPADQTHPETLTWTIVVSHELLRPMLYEFLGMLPDRVSGILELGSRDAFRTVDVFIGHEIARSRFRRAWDVFEPLLLEDVTHAVGVNASGPFFEVFLDQDKRLFVHGESELAPRVEQVLARYGVQPCREDRLQIDQSVVDEVRTRPVLSSEPGLMIDIDHLLLELRDAWDLVLDEDPERNLDAHGQDIGPTLWQGLVFVDQEDPAGRRHGHAHVWGVADCRRGMEHRICTRAAEDLDWEFREIVSLDRVAFDDRPEELEALSPTLDTEGILLYRVEPLGTVASEWSADDA